MHRSLEFQELVCSVSFQISVIDSEKEDLIRTLWKFPSTLCVIRLRSPT